MMSKIKTIIVVVVILAVGFFGYSYFFVSNKDTTTNLKDISKPGAITTDAAGGTATSSKEISQNDQYVRQLIALRAISFNFDLFSDDAYKILHAANTDIPPEEKGRHNPFAPIEAGDGNFLDATTTTPANMGFQITSTTTPRTPVIPTAPKTGNLKGSDKFIGS